MGFIHTREKITYTAASERDPEGGSAVGLASCYLCSLFPELIETDTVSLGGN